MEAETERYSDKRLKDRFSIYLLLSEPLQFNTTEILAAVREDYPQLSWSDGLSEPETGEPGEGFDVDTGTGGFAAMFGAVDENAPSHVAFTTVPGPCDLEWGTIVERSKLTFPGVEQAIQSHVSQLMISLPSVDQSLEARFDAARRLTCLGAVFAKLPVCLGVYFPSADLVVAPTQWASAADTALRGEVPVFEWISFAVTPVPDGTDPVPVSAQSIGVAAFTGYELIMPVVPLPPGEVVQWVYAGTRMVLERGHEFRDSNTMGIEGDDLKIRIRHVPEGKHGAQTDMWALLHPKSKVDEIKMFGPRTGMPPPPGFNNEFRGDEDSLRKRLYALVAGGRRRRASPG